MTIETQRLGENEQLIPLLEGVSEQAEDDFGRFGPACALHDGKLSVTFGVDADSPQDALGHVMDVFGHLLRGVLERDQWPTGLEVIGVDVSAQQFVGHLELDLESSEDRELVPA